MVRKFGVEIEIETPGRFGDESRDWLAPIVQDAVASLNSYRTENVGYSHRVTPYWKITSDGSVSRGSEVVSPVLKGANGEQQVRAVCANLRAHYPTDIALSTDCGVHIHLDIMSTSWAPTTFTRGDGQTIMDIRRRSPKFTRITNRLFETSRWFDTAIQQILPPSRRTNGYCRPFENGYSADEWFEWFENYYGNLNGRGSARYYRINFANCFNEFGTFEWRSHAGSINATKIMQWTKLCQKFLTFSYAPEWQHKDPHDFDRDLDGMINCFELPADQARFWRNRARQLGQYEGAEEYTVATPTAPVVMGSDEYDAEQMNNDFVLGLIGDDESSEEEEAYREAERNNELIRTVPAPMTVMLGEQGAETPRVDNVEDFIQMYRRRPDRPSNPRHMNTILNDDNNYNIYVNLRINQLVRFYLGDDVDFSDYTSRGAIIPDQLRQFYTSNPVLPEHARPNQSGSAGYTAGISAKYAGYSNGVNRYDWRTRFGYGVDLNKTIRGLWMATLVSFEDRGPIQPLHEVDRDTFISNFLREMPD